MSSLLGGSSSDSSGGLGIGEIVGIAVGGLLALVTIIGIIYFLKDKMSMTEIMKQNQSNEEKAD